jgi:hypothetical protein
MKDGKKTTLDALRMALGLPETVKTAKGLDSTKNALRNALGIKKDDVKNSEKTPEKTLPK